LIQINGKNFNLVLIVKLGNYADGGQISVDDILREKAETDQENTHRQAAGEEMQPYSSRVQHLIDTSEDVTPKRYADGGDVRSNKGPVIVKKSAEEIQKGATQSGWQPDTWKKNIKEAFGYADGGQVGYPAIMKEHYDKKHPKMAHMGYYSEGGEIKHKISDLEHYYKANYADGGEIPVNVENPEINPNLINPNPGSQFQAAGIGQRLRSKLITVRC